MKIHKSLTASRKQAQSGMSYVEVVVSTGLAITFIVALIAMGGSVMGLIHRSKDDIATSQSMQERIEQLRMANWRDITDANALSTKVLSREAQSAEGLSSLIEVFTISAHPPQSGLRDVVVRRQDGTTTVVSSEPALATSRLVRVDVSYAWQGMQSAPRNARSTSTLIANRGISQ